MLLERDAELAVIRERIDAARAGAGGLLLIEGPAGIGKTQLVRSVQALALTSDMTVLHARGGELERGFPFGVVRELFEGIVRRAPVEERDALLAGAAGLAAPVLDARHRAHARVEGRIAAPKTPGSTGSRRGVSAISGVVGSRLAAGVERAGGRERVSPACWRV